MKRRYFTEDDRGQQQLGCIEDALNSDKHRIPIGIRMKLSGYRNDATGAGVVFSSSTIFRLPDGSKRSPDVAWVKRSRWNALMPEEQEQFPPIAPDFVIELRSATDNLQKLQDKMQAYLTNGVRLAWLIDPQNQQVEIYRGDVGRLKPLRFSEGIQSTQGALAPSEMK